MKEKEPFKEKIGLILKFIGGILVQIPIIFIPAWTIKWAEGWMWIGIFTVYAVGLSAYLLKHDIELLKKRMTYKLPSQKWDRYIMYGFFITIPSIWIIPGFDFRFGWSPSASSGIFLWTNITWWVELIGIVGTSVSLLIIFFVMKHNTYLARIVEIQDGQEGGHKVITTGPYRVVRHPMYGAFSLMLLCVPLLLGSYYGLIPAVLSAALLVTRTVFEDKMLHKELEGYTEYAQKTRYRLIPGIW